jgi:hypothetical protein
MSGRRGRRGATARSSSLLLSLRHRPREEPRRRGRGRSSHRRQSSGRQRDREEQRGKEGWRGELGGEEVRPLLP